MLFMLYWNYVSEVRKSKTTFEVKRLQSYQGKIFKVIIALLILMLFITLFILTPTKYDFINSPNEVNASVKIIQTFVLVTSFAVAYVSFLLSSVNRVAKLSIRNINQRNQFYYAKRQREEIGRAHV